MVLIMNDTEYECYESISKGVCPKNCGQCLIYKLGLACDGEGDCMLQFFADAGNDEGIEIEINNSLF